MKVTTLKSMRTLHAQEKRQPQHVPVHVQDDFEDEPYSEEEPVMSDIEEAERASDCLDVMGPSIQHAGLHGPRCRLGWLGQFLCR